MAQLSFPSGPSAGQLYVADNGTTYVWDTSIGTGVWRAVSTVPLFISVPGTVTGTATVGQTLTYSANAAASGGEAPYTISYTWRKASDGTLLQTGGATYVIPASLIGDSVYVLALVTDSNTPTGTATARSNYIPAPGTSGGIQGSGIPTSDWAPSPSTGPNASPDTVNTATLKGTASGTWNGTLPATLTATGDLQINLNGGAWGSSVTVTAAGGTVAIRWNPTAIATAADGAILTGTVTRGGETNNYTFTVDKSVDAGSLNFADLTSQALTTTVTSASVTPAGFNVPLSATFAGTATDGLTTPLLSAGGLGFAASPVTVNPGDALQLQGTTGGTVSTAYGITITLGGQTDTWTATTSAASPAITTPSISTPASGVTGVGTAAGITITSSAYSSSGGAGTHASSDWELATDSAFTTVVASLTGSATSLTSWTVAKPPLSATTVYYVRVRYTSNATVVTSNWSAGSMFTTGSLIPSTYTLVGGNNLDPCYTLTRTSSGLYVYGNGSSVSPGPVYQSADLASWSTNTGYTGNPSPSSLITLTNGTFAKVSSTGYESFTTTNGTSWASGPVAAASDLGDYVYSTALRALVGGGSSTRPGRIYSTVDGGITWTPSNIVFTDDTQTSPQNTAWGSEGNVINLGPTGTYYRSAGGGVNWTAMTRPAPFNGAVAAQVTGTPNVMVMTIRGGGVAAADQKLCYSTNQGLSWTTINSPSTLASTAGSTINLYTYKNYIYHVDALPSTGAVTIKISSDGANWSAGTTFTVTTVGLPFGFFQGPMRTAALDNTNGVFAISGPTGNAFYQIT